MVRGKWGTGGDYQNKGLVVDVMWLNRPGPQKSFNV